MSLEQENENLKAVIDSLMSEVVDTRRKTFSEIDYQLADEQQRILAVARNLNAIVARLSQMDAKPGSQLANIELALANSTVELLNTSNSITNYFNNNR